MNDKNIEISPSIKIDPKELFGVSCEFDIYKFKEKTEHVPDIDQHIFLTQLQLFQYLLVSLRIDGYLYKVIMAQANLLISNK